MAITRTTGSAASTTVPAASLALPSFNLTAGQNVYVKVGLDSTASAVTSITDTKGNAYSFVVAVNGTGVRVEWWKSVSVGVQAANVITINVSPNCNIEGEAEEYAAVSSEGVTATASGSSIYPRIEVATQDGNNFVLGGFSFACVSGDTLTAQNGTEVRKSIPAATAVGGALYDNTQVGNGTLVNMGLISTSRQWAAAGLELRSGEADIGYSSYASTTAPSLQQAKDVRFLRVLAPLGGGGSIAPPSGEGQFWPPPMTQQGS